MAVYEKGRERGDEEHTGQTQRMGAARRLLPRVDFSELNYEQRRPPYNHNGRDKAEARNQGEPQQGERR